MLSKLIKLGNIIHSFLNRYVVCIIADIMLSCLVEMKCKHLYKVKDLFLFHITVSKW